MGSQQQQSGTGSKQNSPQKTAKDQDADKKKSGQGACGTGACSTSADDAPDADDEMAADRMDSEGHIADTKSPAGKSKKGGDAGQAI